MLVSTDDVRVTSLKPLLSPIALRQALPMSDKLTESITQARERATQIIRGRDDKLLVVVGPCSVHDPKAALEYAQLLQTCAKAYQDTLHIIMRVYFEKPRTTVGWKGMINDPDLNGSFDVNKGLGIARKLLLDINAMGLPTGTEFLDTIIPQYIADLISWGAIGARTTQSQIHRELTSGLSMPVGFKNSTTGNVQIAVDAICAARQPHHFLSIDKQGASAVVSTEGNPDCHVILRGSKTETNYSEKHIAKAQALLAQQACQQGVMVDCSHGNSQKDYRRQMTVVDAICQQLVAGNQAIMGVMIESNLRAGKQSLDTQNPLVYGQSITDACVSWEQTAAMLSQLAEAITARRRITATHYSKKCSKP